MHVGSEMGDENDFDRATELEESEASSYYYEEIEPEKKQKGPESDESEDEGFYMPTVL